MAGQPDNKIDKYFNKDNTAVSSPLKRKSDEEHDSAIKFNRIEVNGEFEESVSMSTTDQIEAADLEEQLQDEVLKDDKSELDTSFSQQIAELEETDPGTAILLGALGVFKKQIDHRMDNIESSIAKSLKEVIKLEMKM